MDGCSWMLQASAVGGGEHDAVMQQQLSQIYMLMDMEEHNDPYAGRVAPSPSSSSFHSGDSSLILAAATTTSTTTATSYHHHQQPEVSSQIPPPVYGTAVDVANPKESRQSAVASAGAFRPYSRWLGPKRNILRPGTGQRAFKKAICVLSKIHSARIAQYYQAMEMAAAAAQGRPSPATGSSDDSNHQQLQLQHVLSERKRREKLNDSFKALREVLPPATKKDKASILMRAKDYVNDLKARIAELEEKNRMHVDVDKDEECGDDKNTETGDKIEVDIDRSVEENATQVDKCQELHVKIVLGSSSGCSAMDAVASILQGLNDKRDNVSLLAMNTANVSSSGRLPHLKSSSPRPTVRLQVKSSSCDKETLKESVVKVVREVIQSEKVKP
uniref:BHLH domain-containing protein n=1 Tax=Leersia perrieri TaxID=77586 RepID=A0A0D9WDQ1_9ORYZ